MTKDILILRELANQYAQLAWSPKQAELWKIQAAVNDLHPIRPTVLMHELPWHELNADGSLTLRCEDPEYRAVEEQMRRVLFQQKYFPGDQMIQPYFSVRKIITSTGIGVEIHEEVKATDKENWIVSHRYTNQFETMEDVEKLHAPVITYQKEESLRRFWKISEAIGDILPVKLVGADSGYDIAHSAWDVISTHMGADALLYNMIDEPELMHALVEKLTEIELETFRQYEEGNLFNPDSLETHCSAAASEDLRKQPLDLEHVKLSNLWGRGYAQILAAVSPDMHDEFEVQYAKKALAGFGLVYYGCCEPLDRKIDIIRQIPNLRKISITPWADINLAAEAIGKDYVVAAKPNPANILAAASNPDVVRAELRKILNACRRNGCACELLLKDISTVGYRLENLVEWHRVAREEIEND